MERDKKDGGVACYIKHDICFNTEKILPKNIKVIFVDLLQLIKVPTRIISNTSTVIDHILISSNEK